MIVGLPNATNGIMAGRVGDHKGSPYAAMEYIDRIVMRNFAL